MTVSPIRLPISPPRRRRVLRRRWPPDLPRLEASELLDDPSAWDGSTLRANLRDIRRVNRLGGGTAAVLRRLPALLALVPPDRQPLLLDLATGSADIPLALARWLRRLGRPARIIASDLSGEVLAVAREHAGDPAIAFARFDARALPLADRSVDLVLCSQALHHCRVEDAVAILREMHRVARVGCVVNDLARSRGGYVAAWLSSRLFTRNRLTRHDAPLSIRRAFTPNELAELLAQAGILGASVRRAPLFRMTATWTTIDRGTPR